MTDNLEEFDESAVWAQLDGIFAVDEEVADAQAKELAQMILAGTDPSRRARTTIIQIAAETQPGYARLIATRAAHIVIDYMMLHAELGEITFMGTRLNGFLHTARRVVLGIHPPAPTGESE